MNEFPVRGICFAFSFVFFILAAVGWAPDPWPWRPKLIAAGLTTLTVALWLSFSR